MTAETKYLVYVKTGNCAVNDTLEFRMQAQLIFEIDGKLR